MLDALDGIANELRISRITSIRKGLVDERDTRTVLSKKYRKVLKIVHSIHAVLLFTTYTLTVLGTLLPVPFAVRVIGTAGGMRPVFDCQPGEQKIMFRNTKSRKH